LRELDELVGEYVLGTLVGDERLLFEQKIRVDSIAPF
jgi:anti-sigma-K factor RskA